MEIFNEIKPLRAFLAGKRVQQFSIGLVPTMGALHQGHLELIKASRLKNDITVCSIYVNPTQFNNQSDLEKYPRTLKSDTELLAAVGCDVIFAPINIEMYRKKSDLYFDFGHLDKILEGEFRPGHFSGVALVVSKLFNIVQPTSAYFGQKDFQQFKIISKLVEELLFDVTISSVPIVREPNGLAMSSRNQRLSDADRAKATLFYQSLLMARSLLQKGEPFEFVETKIREKCEAVEGIKLEYIELVDTENLKPAHFVLNKTILLIAGFVGDVRLIDNLILE